VGAHEHTPAELTHLLGLVRDGFPAEQAKYVEDFIAADEYQLALEWILDGMAELGVPISPPVVSLARALASRLGVLEVIAARLERLQERR